jgi:membrane protease YdiL (CAAX protease family)
MWCPGLAGMLTQLIYEHTLRGLGWKLGKFKYLALAYLLPLGYCLITYGFTWLSGLGSFPNLEFVTQLQQSYTSGAGSVPLLILIYTANMAVFGLIGGLFSGLGEEIGWRGFFVPELYKVMSYTKAMFVSGGIWVLWHMPLIFFADYNLPGVPRWYAATMFTIMVIGLSFAFGWLRLKSGSLWPAALLHASHNLFIQSIFTPLTGIKKITPYIIDEFGIALAIMGIVVAIIFWRKSTGLPKPLSGTSLIS